MSKTKLKISTIQYIKEWFKYRGQQNFKIYKTEAKAFADVLDIEQQLHQKTYIPRPKEGEYQIVITNYKKEKIGITVNPKIGSLQIGRKILNAIIEIS